MKYPSKKNLIPLAEQFIHDHPRLFVLKTGKVTNGKQGLKNTTFESLYDLAVMMYSDGYIQKCGNFYSWVKNYKGMEYPYVRVS